MVAILPRSQLLVSGQNTEIQANQNPILAGSVLVMTDNIGSLHSVTRSALAALILRVEFYLSEMVTD